MKRLPLLLLLVAAVASASPGTPVDRKPVRGGNCATYVPLANGTPTAIFTVRMNTMEGTLNESGGEVQFLARALDGTASDAQVVHGSFHFGAVDAGGKITATASTVDASPSTFGTLTVVPTLTDAGGDALAVSLTVSSSLKPTTLDVSWRVVMDGSPTVVVAQ